MISIDESFDLFISTLKRLDNKNLELSNEDLTYEIFEELDSEYHTFLHAITVDKLIEAGKLPKSLRNRILKLREDIRPIMESKSKIQLYRNDSEWRILREEANSLIKEINTFANKA